MEGLTGVVHLEKWDFRGYSGDRTAVPRWLGRCLWHRGWTFSNSLEHVGPQGSRILHVQSTSQTQLSKDIVVNLPQETISSPRCKKLNFRLTSPLLQGCYRRKSLVLVRTAWIWNISTLSLIYWLTIKVGHLPNPRYSTKIMFNSQSTLIRNSVQGDKVTDLSVEHNW